jgi:glyoxylase-like metal-dependent hydrolase (beta-lactamase superfamily II)
VADFVEPGGGSLVRLPRLRNHGIDRTGGGAVSFFRQFHDSRDQAFTYLLADETSGAAVAVDPLPEGIALPLLGLIDELGLHLDFLLCTHVHDGQQPPLESLRRRCGARLAASERAPVAADLRLRHGDTVDFGPETIRVLGTPGHTPGCLSYLWRDRVLTGDALLIRACGRTDLPNGDAGQLFDSITRLLVLPGDTLLFPGHETHGRTVSTIAEEREHNPCVAGRSRDEFITFRSQS